MIEIFVCCEGITDVSVMKPLIEKSAPVSAVCKTHNELRHIRVHSIRTAKKGTEKDDVINRKAYMRRIAHIANENNSDYIAYHQDADRKYERVYRSVSNDFSEQREAGFKCLPVVPKEMTESWLLADEKAYVSVFGRVPDNPALPKKPETIWGKKEDADSNYPKHVISRILKQYNKEPNRDAFAEISDKCDIEVLKSRSKSFTRFSDDLDKLIQE